MINLGAQIFNNPQKTGATLTRPRRSGVDKGAKTTSTNGKSTDLGIPELQKCVEHFQGGIIPAQFFNWKKITKNQVIPDIIQHGLKLLTQMPLLNTQDQKMKEPL